MYHLMCMFSTFSGTWMSEHSGIPGKHFLPGRALALYSYHKHNLGITLELLAFITSAS